MSELGIWMLSLGLAAAYYLVATVVYLVLCSRRPRMPDHTRMMIAWEWPFAALAFACLAAAHALRRRRR